MHRVHTAALAALTVCALMLGAAGSAEAQTPAATPAARTVALTGNHGLKATYTIKRFADRGGQLVAIGTVRGTMRKNGDTRRIRRARVAMPAAVFGAGSGRSARQLPNLPNACQILNLTLGPINLNLLGLVVRTNQINVRIDAVPGAGNLLGNLLCAITGLLNPTGALGQLTQSLNDLTASLNALLALLPRSA